MANIASPEMSIPVQTPEGDAQGLHQALQNELHQTLGAKVDTEATQIGDRVEVKDPDEDGGDSLNQLWERTGGFGTGAIGQPKPGVEPAASWTQIKREKDAKMLGQEPPKGGFLRKFFKGREPKKVDQTIS